MADDVGMKNPEAILYGIPNCDTVRKARAWCDAHGLAIQFHDFKKLGVPEQALQQWLQALGPDALINKRGTTWRQLHDASRAATADSLRIAEVLQAHPSLIKRPVVDWSEPSQPRFTVGFDEAVWSRLNSARTPVGHA